MSLGHIVLGLLSFEATVLGGGAALALVVVGVAVTVAARAVRRMATTDGRDQDHLGRAIRQLRLAIAIKLLFVASVAITVPVLAAMGAALTGAQLLRLTP